MKKMSNKKWIILTIVMLAVFFGAYITYRVIKDYRGKLILVSEKRITEAAQKCFNEEKCDSYPITLGKLYSLGYLTEEINPLTKEVYNYDSYVDQKEGNLSFNPLY